MAKPTLLFAVSEHLHYIKTGGLADVASALPKALERYYDVTLLMPLYDCMNTSPSLKEVANFSLTIDALHYRFTLYEAANTPYRTLFIYEANLCKVTQIYSGDVALRFALFSHAIAYIAQQSRFSVLSLHDWHTALAALFAKEKSFEGCIHFNIHNMLFQGVFALHNAAKLGISKRYLRFDALEFYDQLNFMKAGIIFSDLITTVSESYANALLQEPKAHGLASTLHYYKKKFYGVQNGLDMQEFDPMHDPMLQVNYDANTLQNRAQNRDYICNRFALPKTVALFAFIGRLNEQKGVLELIAWLQQETLHNATLLIIGEGDAQIAAQLRALQATQPNLHFFEGYDEALSRNIYGGCDFLLMPSRFEPSGLNQLIAMRYGAVVIAHDVDGLHDTIAPSATAPKQRGLLMPSLEPHHFSAAFSQAVALYEKRTELEALQRYTMSIDLGWQRSAARYHTLLSQSC